MLADFSPKMVSGSRLVSYPDDPLGPLLTDLRERKRLKPYPYQSPVPSKDSRFGLQISEVQQVVLPESAEKVFHMRKGSGIVRLPNYLELNVIGNMYPGLLTARRMGPDASDTWEYFGDPYQNQDGVGHLYGMRSVYGPDAPSGLSQVGPSLLSDYQSANMGFRPFIIPEQ